MVDPCGPPGLGERPSTLYLEGDSIVRYFYTAEDGASSLYDALKCSPYASLADSRFAWRLRNPELQGTVASAVEAAKAERAFNLLADANLRRCYDDLRVFRMAVFDGMRPSEIFAVQVGKSGTNAVRIDQRICGGHLDTPKGRKRQETRIVALSPGTMSDLVLWKTFLPGDDPATFLFPSETGVTPLRPNNLWKREFRPRLDRVGLGWVNFQVLRRANASLSRKAKIDDKVSADQRGHGLGVSLAVYATSDLEQKIEAVERLESDVLGGWKLQL